MQKRTRKFFGAVAMLAFVIVYALVAMMLAQARPTQEAPVLLQTLIYAVLGPRTAAALIRCKAV